jgi:hypothetical protein
MGSGRGRQGGRGVETDMNMMNMRREIRREKGVFKRSQGIYSTYLYPGC